MLGEKMPVSHAEWQVAVLSLKVCMSKLNSSSECAQGHGPAGISGFGRTVLTKRNRMHQDAFKS